MIEAVRQLAEAKVRFLIIGGQAMRLAGLQRMTMDWDLFIPPRDLENIKGINSVLDDELDLPLLPLGPRGENFVQTYQLQWGMIQFHLGVPGVPNYDNAEARAISHSENSVTVKRLCGEDLLASKLAANRPSDEVDLKYLMELQRVGRLV